MNDQVNELLDQYKRWNLKVQRKLTTVSLVICIPIALYVITSLIGFQKNMKAAERIGDLITKQMVGAASTDADHVKSRKETSPPEFSIEIQSGAPDDTETSPPEASPDAQADTELPSGIPSWAEMAVSEWERRYQDDYFKDAVTIKMSVGDTRRMRNVWRDCEYYSTDTSVVEVDGQGIVTAVGQGTAFVAIKSSLGELTDCERYEVS